MLGSICAQQGRFEEALTLTRTAHATMPWSNPVIGQLAALLVHRNSHERRKKLQFSKYQKKYLLLIFLRRLSY
jgi:hypothetical protein